MSWGVGPMLSAATDAAGQLSIEDYLASARAERRGEQCLQADDDTLPGAVAANDASRKAS